MNESEISFGENLKKIRKSRGLTRAQLAQAISYSAKSIEKWEDGTSIPPLSTICRLQAVLGISLEELVYSRTNNIRYYLGIDGGATKTTFLLQNKYGEKISECVLESSNPVDIGNDDCKNVLKRGIESICSKEDYPDISLFAGLSGVNTKARTENIKSFLTSLGLGICDVGNDIENVLELTLSGDDGIAVICGTGVAAFSQKNGIRKRFAGYGYLFDNGGSGFDIGRDAFEAAYRHIDGRAEPTLLTKLLNEKLHSPIDEAIDSIYGGGKRFIASMAPLVFDAYAKGDAVATDILKRNSAALAGIINTAAKQFENAPVKVGICGGLCNKDYILKKFLMPLIDSRVNLFFEKKAAVNGAVMLAKKAVLKNQSI